MLSRLVILGLVFALVRTRRSTAAGLEDERREGLSLLILHILVLDVLVAILISSLAANVYREVVRALLRKHVTLAVACRLLSCKLAAVLCIKLLVYSYHHACAAVYRPSFVSSELYAKQQVETCSF